MQRETPRNPLLIQVLSVYLLLLAFFVVLNSISHFELARSRAVTGSLNETFAAEGLPTKRTVPLVSSRGDVLANAAVLSRIGELISTELSLAQVREVEPGRTMEVTVPVESLFRPGLESIDPLHRPLVEKVAKLLADTPRGVRYDLDILLTGESGDDLAVGRSAFLASVFVREGAPRRNVIAGIEHNPSGRLRLLFHVRPISEGRFRFDEEGT
jgi:hypothetical protein